MRTVTDKIDAVTGISEDRKNNRPPCPRSVKIELTGRCNFRCAFCASGDKLRDTGDMDWDLYRRLLTDMRSSGVEELGMFYLGESFILKWLPKAIQAATDEGFPYIFITTNGALASYGMVDDCMEAGLKSLKFSLNFGDEEQFKEVTRVKGSLFQTVIDNIKSAHEIRRLGDYDCGLFASYIKYDGEQGKRMEALVEELSPYLDEVYALPLYSQANLTGDENSLAGWKVSGGNPGRADNMRKPLPCWALFTEARISYDGHMSACCFDHDGRFRMGDLKEMSFMEAWHSQPFQELREKHLQEQVQGTACEDCIAYG